jgi:site-specific DNA-methyltransferase (adenine-specific)
MDGMHSMSNVELALTSFDENSKKVSINKDLGSEKRIHITQKPIALYNWLLDRYAKPDFKILDTHLGSGSHAIACYYFGCELTACELDSEYYEASLKRFKTITAQQKLF